MALKGNGNKQQKGNFGKVFFAELMVQENIEFYM